MMDDKVMLIVGEEKGRRRKRRRVTLGCQHRQAITKWKLQI